MFVRHLVWEAERFIFPFINLCATTNTSPALPEYLNDVVTMITQWQLGILDDDGLFQTFHMSRINMTGNLMARYQVITNYSYSWWKDWFDMLPWEMPNRITVEEVQELCQHHEQQLPAGYLLLVDRHKPKVGVNPLLTNLRTMRGDLEEFRTQLEALLAWKINHSHLAIEAMAGLEGQVDYLHDVIAASEEILDAKQGESQ
ncbi:hypothetical protein EDB19DRAFT_1915215 [Suillus lakei]|nr:hypothetical protein EDB19DRAFT_1915215 [Suillus lakei]